MTHNPSHTPKTLKLISSIMITSFFTGVLIPTATVGAVKYPPEIPTIDASSYCTYMVDVAYTPNDQSCESCKQAVQFAIDYMIEYVKDQVKGTYFLWTFDASLLVFNGLVEGFIASGYQPEIDWDELKATIDYWVDTCVGPQIFPVTRLLASLGAIAIGVTGYLVSLCNGEDPVVPKTTEIRQNRPLVKIWMMVLQLLGKVD